MKELEFLKKELKESEKLTTCEEIYYFDYNLRNEVRFLNTYSDGNIIETVEELESIYNSALTYEDYRNRQEPGKIVEIQFFSGTKKGKDGDNLELSFISYKDELVKLCEMFKKIEDFEEYFDNVEKEERECIDIKKFENNRIKVNQILLDLSLINKNLPQKKEVFQKCKTVGDKFAKIIKEKRLTPKLLGLYN